FRSRQKQPPATSVLGESVVVKIRVKAEQRKLEPVLPARLPVTRPLVATVRRQDRLHVQFETNRLLFSGSNQTDRTHRQPDRHEQGCQPTKLLKSKSHGKHSRKGGGKVIAYKAGTNPTGPIHSSQQSDRTANHIWSAATCRRFPPRCFPFHPSTSFPE